MGVTRRDLRRDIARDLGDLLVCTATQIGSNVTFYDSNNLVGEIDAYRGRQVLFTAGTAANLGQMRSTTGSSPSTRAVGWGIPLPAITAVGDEMEMVNTRGTGYRFIDIHDAINRSIKSVKDKALQIIGVDTFSYARGSGIPIPNEFATLENLQWQSSADSTVWNSIPFAQRLNGHGWHVDPVAREVVIGGSLSRTINGRVIKMWGGVEPVELFSDDDETNVDYDFIVLQTQASLARAKFLRMPTPETERTMSMLQGMAREAKGRTVTELGPFSVDLRR